LKGEVEESNNALERLRKQQREMTADFDSRLLKLSPPAVPIAGADPTASTPVTLTAGDGSATAPPSGTAVPPVAAIPPPAAPSPPPVVIDPAVRRADYEKAFNTLKEGKYTEAIRDFKNFVMAYPAGEYTDNAYYWLAEAYYVNRDFPSARENFRKVTETFPQSGKLADAYLKLGFIEYENGQYAASKDLLNEVIRRFPEASAAKMAEKRLERMRQEKR
jgi:tol-pal system protein YbgF